MPHASTTNCKRAERAITSRVVTNWSTARAMSLPMCGSRICTPRCVRGRAQVAGVVLAAGAALVDSVLVDEVLEVVVDELEDDEELDEPRLSVL